MSNVAAILFEDSKGTLRYRLKDGISLSQVTSGVTIAVTVSFNGTAVITARSVTYDSAAKLWSGDDETGAWTCDVAASEVATSGTYIAVFTVTASAVTVHTTTLRIPVVVDTGRRST